MTQFLFRGIAEGLTGRSSCQARNIQDVLNKFPVLKKAKNKLTIKNNVVSGFCACDG